MGSFTSMPKIRPAPNAEDQDVDFGSNRVSLEAFLKRCRDELGNLPAVIPRQSRQRTTSLSKDGNEGFYISNAFALMNTEKIRVFQWNALSQGKYPNLQTYRSGKRKIGNCYRTCLLY